MGSYQKISPPIVKELSQIVGEKYVLFDQPEKMAAYSRDEVADPIFAHMPEVVVKPTSAAEISAIMKLANREHIPVTPRGAGSGLSGGAVPIYGGIVLSYRPNNEEGHRRLIKKLEQHLRRRTKCAIHGHECHEGLFARNLFVGQRIPLAGVAHQNGTCRFGRDPQTSVLDVNCKAHDLDNLYVVDGGFFASSSAVNPALTIMANAMRVGDHLKERLA